MVACAKKKGEEAVLPPQKMAAFLVDVYIAESRVEKATLNRDSAIKLFIPYEQLIMKKHGISDSLLKHSYQYYMEHPRDYEKIYDAVIDTLSLREQLTYKKDLAPPLKPKIPVKVR